MRSPFVKLTALLAVGTLLFAACGDSDDEESSSATTAGAAAASGDSAALLEGVELISDGKLTVCSDLPYEPFEFEDDAGGITGFDYDVVAAMSADLGLEQPEFKTTPFDTIIQALLAGDCDVIGSAMTITDAREEQVDFTQPYFDADQSLLVRTADEATYATLDSLAGKSIGVQAGTTGADYATENTPDGATVREYQGAADLFAALAAGEIDAILQDFPVNAYRASEQPEEFAVTETFPTGEQYGFAVTQGSTQLLAALDAALQAIRDSGTYDEIYTEWFGTAPA
jgi:polar amino acid transport system substrate-binding protein